VQLLATAELKSVAALRTQLRQKQITQSQRTQQFADTTDHSTSISRARLNIEPLLGTDADSPQLAKHHGKPAFETGATTDHRNTAPDPDAAVNSAATASSTAETSKLVSSKVVSSKVESSKAVSLTAESSKADSAAIDSLKKQSEPNTISANHVASRADSSQESSTRISNENIHKLANERPGVAGVDKTKRKTTAVESTAPANSSVDNTKIKSNSARPASQDAPKIAAYQMPKALADTAKAHNRLTEVKTRTTRPPALADSKTGSGTVDSVTEKSQNAADQNRAKSASDSLPVIKPLPANAPLSANSSLSAKEL